MTTKQKILLEEIIFKKLPGFETTEMQNAILKLIELYPTCIDVENLVEHALANKGHFNFIDEKGRDFDDYDNSDSKTVTVNIKTGKAEIIGVENKIGSIRITIFNPISEESVSYLYIPFYYVDKMARECFGQNAGKKRFVITWSQQRPKKYKDNKIGYFNQYEKFRINSFEDLATMTDEKFYQLNEHLRPNISLQDLDLSDDPKIYSKKQTPNPYSLTTVQQEILNSVEIESIYLSD